jgi:hypothetical protein
VVLKGGFAITVAQGSIQKNGVLNAISPYAQNVVHVDVNLQDLDLA